MVVGIGEWIAFGILCTFALGLLTYLSYFFYKRIQRINLLRRKATLFEDLQELIFVEWSDELSNNDTCSVCCETYVCRADICIFPCKHASHVGCAEQWISRGLLRCPACNGEIVPNSKHYKGMSMLTTPPNERRFRNSSERKPLLKSSSTVFKDVIKVMSNRKQYLVIQSSDFEDSSSCSQKSEKPGPSHSRPPIRNDLSSSSDAATDLIKAIKSVSFSLTQNNPRKIEEYRKGTAPGHKSTQQVKVDVHYSGSESRRKKGRESV